MTTLLQQLRLLMPGMLWRRARGGEAHKKAVPAPVSYASLASPLVDIAPDDPVVAYFLKAPGSVEIEMLQLASPALETLKAAGVKMVIPLVSQGELVGLMNLGPRRSEQDYSVEDRRVLDTLAAQAAPAVRVAQMVREQQVIARERERMEQELRVARLIQQTLLPKELPDLPGWTLAAYYQAAREVGGDFYDFLYFEDGQLGILIGDVTDKGVPAALVMATTRSILRAVALRHSSPSKVLELTNDLLYPDIPPKMFVTCFYGVLDPMNGRLRYANAGHDLPYRHHKGRVSELRAVGMPLGLMPGMDYEERETVLAPGENIVFYSDGLVEAHNPERAMFGFPHLMHLLEEHRSGDTIDFLLDQLEQFTGENWEQEDDITLVTLSRLGSLTLDLEAYGGQQESDMGNDNPWHTLGEFTVVSAPGNERMAMEQVAEAVKEVHLSKRRLEQLKTAVAEATMNAMEHGNKYRPDLPVLIRVQASATDLVVLIRDFGGGVPIPTPETPDIEAKLAELQTSRGWGLFLIKNLVDDMLTSSDDTHHVVELIMHLDGENHDNKAS